MAHRNALYFESDASKAASEYFNSLPFEERKKLAPLLDHYRQMGLAEAADNIRGALVKTTKRANQIRRDADHHTLAPGTPETPEEGR